jgi:hypothetical protein
MRCSGAYCNATFGLFIGGEFLNQVSDYNFLREESNPKVYWLVPIKQRFSTLFFFFFAHGPLLWSPANFNYNKCNNYNNIYFMNMDIYMKLSYFYIF